MQIFVNDLSVAGQFPNPVAFRAVLEPMLVLRAKRPDLQRAVYCSRSFSMRQATAMHSVQEAILQTRDRLYIRLVLGWLSKSGPFWDDERFENPDDYFHFRAVDVTDQGLGEAARRMLEGLKAGSYSFADQSRSFEVTPLTVIHGLEEAPITAVEIPNYWATEALERAVDSTPRNWNELLDRARARFNLLMIYPEVENSLHGQPFHNGIAERVFVLLEILQTLAQETNGDGSFTAAGLELWQMHSVGGKALLTDESESNKRDFEQDLTFRDPHSGAPVFCPWHGKIKPNQFRIHFEWPRPRNQRFIKIFYIGPKITKEN